MNLKKILLVDDEESFTRLVRMNLEATGKYDVQVENTGRIVVEAAKKFRPDLILLDILMPDLSGCEVARRLKEDAECKSIPVVFITALTPQQDRCPEDTMIRAYPVLSKPVGFHALVDCIKKTMDGPSA